MFSAMVRMNAVSDVACVELDVGIRDGTKADTAELFC